MGNEDALRELLHDAALSIAEDIQTELSSKTAIVAGEGGSLQKVKYTTEIIDDGDSVIVSPTFDNSIDEYSNSAVIQKHGFEGNLTLGKIINRLSK